MRRSVSVGVTGIATTTRSGRFSLMSWIATRIVSPVAIPSSAIIAVLPRTDGRPLPAVYVDAFGDIFQWYGMYGRYDEFVHFFGGAPCVAGILALISHFASLRYGIPYWLALGASSVIGTLYEGEEYVEDVIRGTSVRLGDGPDTVTDLLAQLIGSVAVLALVYVLNASKK